MESRSTAARPRAAIFLAAGQGSRLRPLTEGRPKCLLPVGDETILDTLLPAMLGEPEREIVVVGGYCAGRLRRHLDARYPEGRVRLAVNEDFANDVNILSLDIGVDALLEPERGYTVIETDLLLEPGCWRDIHAAERTDASFWVTSGRYNPALTGGIVHAPAPDAGIEAIAYVPAYDAAYEGWHKMVGMLSVAPAQVEGDRRHRKAALRRSARQYYMAPWIEHPQDLACRAVDLGDRYARSFNTVDEYERACHEYIALRFGEGRNEY